MNIRRANSDDAGQIAEIYNFYILNTHHTFETEPLSAEEMRERVAEICENYPYLVAEENGEILGYVYATQFKLRQAYKHSVEASIYVKNQAKQKGIGSKLYEKLLAELAETDVHAIIAGISLPNEASVKFHEKLGYEKVAHFKEVGYKLGRWVDVGFWEMLNRF
ncbi:MAG TPA: arsinothricin resistance N-acetyltransferase ArsN1 family B [Pyrinomonadaceae bacterium]|jgi:phosphinothricin acetyltransferase|nr:arsinothricin resistance N-acetyltransferase ArsN1 family B [Pyrinomonadaceae bacterium]